MRHDSPQSFHISFWRPWLMAVSLLAIPLLIVAGISLANGQPSGLIGAVFGLTAVAIVLLIPIGWTVRTSRWDVDAAGISGHWLLSLHGFPLPLHVPPVGRHAELSKQGW